MADRPQATATLESTGGPGARGSRVLCIMAPTEKGPSEPRLFLNTADHEALFGLGPGLELAAHHVELNKLPYLFVPVATAVAAAVDHVDTSGVTGTSTVTFTGTPLDEEDIAVKVVDGGTVGTAGITIRVSRDGGRVWSRIIRLGTATTYAIPRSGMTWNASSGTLVADDVAYCYVNGPLWDAAGLTAARQLLAAQSVIPRLIVLCGEVDGDNTDLQDVVDTINAHETTDGRYCRILAAGRRRYRDANLQKTRGRMTGAPSDVDFDSVGHTITRNTGSWVTDGFVIGQSVVVAGSTSNNGTAGVLTNVSATVLTFASGIVSESNVNGAGLTITSTGPGDIDFAASGFTITRNIGSWVTDGFKVGMSVSIDGTSSNDGDNVGTVTAVTATVLTLDAGVANEANLSALGVTITGEELAATWREAVADLAGNTPSTEIVAPRVLFSGGCAYRKSPLDSYRRWRPASWAIGIRTMAYSIHVSAADVGRGALEGWRIHNDDGILEEHDERVSAGLLARRLACLTTNDDYSGVFVALPLTLDEDNAILSRLPTALVGDLVCRIAKREGTRRLNSYVPTKRDGTIQEAAAQKIEGYILGQIKSGVMVDSGDGPSASSIDSVTIDRSVNILTPGTLVPVEVKFTPLAYLEQLAFKVFVNVGNA